MVCVPGLQMGGIFVKSPVVKRSIVLAGHKTSVSLEDAFWNALKEIARRRLIDLAGPYWHDRFTAPARQSFVGAAAVRAGVLSQPDSRRRPRGA